MSCVRAPAATWRQARRRGRSRDGVRRDPDRRRGERRSLRWAHCAARIHAAGARLADPQNGNHDKDPKKPGTGRAATVRGEASAVLCRRAGPGVFAACAGSTAGDGADRIHAAGARLENPQNGNHDKDPKKRGTGRAGAAHGEASAALRRHAGPGVSAACAGTAAGDGADRIHAAGARLENPQNGNHDKDPKKRGTGRAGGGSWRGLGQRYAAGRPSG
jgi:hypothetical protein